MGPEWMICGCLSGKPDAPYMLIASKSLHLVEFRMESESSLYHDYGVPIRIPGARNCTLSATAYEVATIFGESYQDCLRKLFSTWSPDDRPLGLLSAQPAINQGDTHAQDQ